MFISFNEKRGGWKREKSKVNHDKKWNVKRITFKTIEGERGGMKVVFNSKTLKVIDTFLSCSVIYNK